MHEFDVWMSGSDKDAPRRPPASEAREARPPSSWKDRMAFREVFLLHAPSTGAATLRQFGRYIYDTIVERRLQEAREPPVDVELRALAEDLRFSARGLAHLGRGRTEGSWTTEEAALSKKAESWAREVLELVRAIESASSGTGGPE